LVKIPSDHNVVGSKWVFQNKQDENGIIVRNKARLVAQGYSQVEGLDFDETFLNGKINELVYVEKSPGFEDSKRPNHVYNLSKALYALKAPHA
jgi:hypothetical protein